MMSLESLDLFDAAEVAGKTPSRPSRNCMRGSIPGCVGRRTPAVTRGGKRSEGRAADMTQQFSFDFDGAGAPDARPSERQHQQRATGDAKRGGRGGRRAASRALALAPLAENERPLTLRGCIQALTDRLGTTDPEVKEITGAVGTVIKVVHKVTKLTDHDLPARPQELRHHLRDALPAAIGLSRSRFNNSLTLLKTLLISIGWLSHHSRSTADLTSFWSDRLGGTSRADPAGALPPFLRFCERLAIEPANISWETVAAYEAWMETETLQLRPRHVAIAVVAAWKRMQARRSDWPPQDLRLPSKRNVKSLDLAVLPESFGADLRGYLRSLESPSPLDPDYGRPLGEVSLGHTRRAIVRAATCLVQSGTPVGDVTGIAVLVQPSAFRAIATVLHAEGLPLLKAAGETGQWTRTAEAIANNLVQAARRWVKLAPDPLSEIIAMQRRMKSRSNGLSEKVQASLAELLTDEERAELFHLPWRAFEIADAMLRDGDVMRAAKLHETALALGIVLVHPLRARDLARLDLDEHFVRDRRGRVTQIAIRTRKRAAVVRAELDPDLAGRIHRHVSAFRPHIPGHAGSAAVFPGPAGGARCASTLGRLIRRLVADQIGKRFTQHLARHLAVDICLDDDPANMVVAQRLLGHRDARTTNSIYGARATLAAHRRFAEAIREQAQRAGLAKPGGGMAKGRRRRR